jgi:DNA polymerase-4
MSADAKPCLSRSILHLDADAFFASVEQRDDPRLCGRPVAVGAGVVASCSYEARRHGVRTGMRLAEARQRCRNLVVVPGEYPRYEQAARHILAICQDRTPLVEAAALDDLYLDLTQPGRDADDPQVGRTAADLRAAIRDETRLSVSVGIGTNKLVARVATKQAKPGRQVRVPAGGERDYLAPWPARVLPGAGGKVGDRLERLNVGRVGEVAAMPADVLQALFGGRGRLLRDLAHGLDGRPVEPARPQQSVSRSTSFEPPVADRDFLRAMLAYLLERACSWLRFRGLAARGLAVTIRYGDFRGDAGREAFRAPVADERPLQEAARDRFDRLYRRRLPLRFVGVALAPLTAPAAQPMLFTDPADERDRRLLAAKDAIRRRFGFTSLLSGAALVLDGRLDRDRENFRLRTACLTR